MTRLARPLPRVTQEMDPLPDDFQELLQDAVAASHMDDRNDLPLFMSDNFRIYCMKVRASAQP